MQFSWSLLPPPPPHKITMDAPRLKAFLQEDLTTKRTGILEYVTAPLYQYNIYTTSTPFT